MSMKARLRAFAEGPAWSLLDATIANDLEQSEAKGEDRIVSVRKWTFAGICLGLIVGTTAGFLLAWALPWT